MCVCVCGATSLLLNEHLPWCFSFVISDKLDYIPSESRVGFSLNFCFSLNLSLNNAFTKMHVAVNCLEMSAALLGIKYFLPDLNGYHMLDWTLKMVLLLALTLLKRVRDLQALSVASSCIELDFEPRSDYIRKVPSSTPIIRKCYKSARELSALS